MKLYNDSLRSIILKNENKKEVEFAPKTTIELPDSLAKKILVYDGIKNADKIFNASKNESEKKETKKRG